MSKLYKLDARVAEQVMGFTIGNEDILEYSADMNTAMELLEYVREKVKSKLLFGNLPHSWSITQTKDGLFRVVLGLGGYSDLPKIQHTSLPTAICIAALRAVGDGKWVDSYLEEVRVK